ncbi:MAG: FAD-binding oxidoreductase [Mycobacteriales bacterium]
MDVTCHTVRVTTEIWEWGGRRHGLSRATTKLIRSRLGELRPHPPAGPVRPRPSRLPAEAWAALVAATGPGSGGGWVRDDHDIRSGHATGRNYLDLLALRSGEPLDAPDAVVFPADHAEVRAVLEACVEHRVAVVPYGGGTSVVGGVAPERAGFAAVVALDLRRLDALREVDPVSLTARLQPGLRGPEAERLLAAHGLTLGHYPQSWARATLGGYAATRSAGQGSAGYGRFDEMVEALVVATPAGDLRLGRAPRSAAGPDLRQLMLGSEGTLGVITELTVRVRRQPEVRRYEGWSLPSLEDGLAAVRRLAQDGPTPDVVRLSDPEETAVTLAMGGPAAGLLGRYLRVRGQTEPCLLVVGWEDTAERVRWRRPGARRLLRRAGAVPLGTAVGDAWRKGRFTGPTLRDDLLDAGVMVETLETAAPWSALADLHRAVREAVTGALAEPATVMCHVSHVYPTGGSLYFTVLARQRPGAEAAQWRAAKQAASAAIVAAGATITHHHAVGADHQAYLAAEVGDLGVDVLRAVKARLDPTGILNPGKLIPPS